jgi:hypothetical protein
VDAVVPGVRDVDVVVGVDRDPGGPVAEPWVPQYSRYSLSGLNLVTRCPFRT